MAFSLPYDIKWLLLTHHAFLIVVVALNWVGPTFYFYKCMHLWRSYRVKLKFTKNSQNGAYWPIWVFKAVIFISLVQGTNRVNASLRKYRHTHFLTCQRSVERLSLMCISDSPPPQPHPSLHVRGSCAETCPFGDKNAYLEVNRWCCSSSETHLRQNLRGRRGCGGRRTGIVGKGFLGDSDSLPPRPHCAALI